MRQFMSSVRALIRTVVHWVTMTGSYIIEATEFCGSEGI